MDQISDRPHTKVRRLWELPEALKKFRYGLSISELKHEMEAACCDRTIRRDLELLEDLGLVVVESVQPTRLGQKLPGLRWRWVHSGGLFDKPSTSTS